MKKIQVSDYADITEAVAAYEEAWENDPDGAIIMNGDEPVCLKGFNLGCGCPKCEDCGGA